MLHSETKAMPVADLHCDLLSFLSRNSKNSPYDQSVRCSIPQLRKGNVKIQTFAIFTETSAGSSKKGWLQAEIFKQLPIQHPEVFEFVRFQEQIDHLPVSNKIGILSAIENASSFCEESDSIDAVFIKLEKLLRKTGKPVYVSLTWNTENRFGGGTLSKTGLKNDGKCLVDFLHQKKIPIDLSHSSDYLAHDILNYLDKKGLQHPVMASHSNLRFVANVPRNLSDEIAKEIIRRKGLIGLNFFRHFVGYDSPDNFIKHLDHLLLLGGENEICFGADFFHDEDLSPQHKKPGQEMFFPLYDSAATYPNLIKLLQEHRSSNVLLEKICYHNLANFLTEVPPF